MREIFKLKVYLFPLLLLTLAAYFTGQSYTAMTREVFSFSVNQRIILVDAGHGGWERGA